jgi:hypothetical protein
MAIREARTETYRVTGDTAEHAHRNLIENLAGSPNDCVSNDGGEAREAAANNRRYMHLGGDHVFKVALTIESADA